MLLPYATFELLLDEAVEDLRRIAKRSPEVVKEIPRLPKQLDAGELVPRLGRLNDPVRRSDISQRVNRIQKALGRNELRRVVSDLSASDEENEITRHKACGRHPHHGTERATNRHIRPFATESGEQFDDTDDHAGQQQPNERRLDRRIATVLPDEDRCEVHAQNQ